MADFDILFVAQAGRLQFEAVLLAASLRASDPNFSGRLICAEPQPGGAWPDDPRIDNGQVRDALARCDVELRPFLAEHFGATYPQGNKIEALQVLEPGRPFLFLDTDTLITGALSSVPFDFSRPSASMRREGSWPIIELYGPGYTQIWSSLYRKFDLDFDSSLDVNQPDEHWARYLYFNAGWFFGSCPKAFGARFLDLACTIRDDAPPELVCQPLDPWLDQIALPLVIHSFGGGRPGQELAGLDGDVTCHWRVLPLLYARESDRVVEVLQTVSAQNWVKKALKAYEPFRRMIYHGKGAAARTLFDRENLPTREQAIRQRLKKEKLWLR